MFWGQVQTSANATDILDVQGFSHESVANFAAFHSRFPEKVSLYKAFSIPWLPEVCVWPFCRAFGLI